jgi:hypothetical protein
VTLLLVSNLGFAGSGSPFVAVVEEATRYRYRFAFGSIHSLLAFLIGG